MAKRRHSRYVQRTTQTKIKGCKRQINFNQIMQDWDFSIDFENANWDNERGC